MGCTISQLRFFAPPLLPLLPGVYTDFLSNRCTCPTSFQEDEAKCTGSCDSCGLAKEKMQCDGSGRIIGGMGAIPLFKWWPIKAYRPCPGLIESGGVYVRKGQDVDGILWGEKGN